MGDGSEGIASRHQEEWMLQEGIASNETPSRKLIGEWILEAWDSLDSETVKNAWKKKKYSWWNE